MSKKFGPEEAKNIDKHYDKAIFSQSSYPYEKVRVLTNSIDDMGKVKTASVDEDWGKISILKVNEYIDAVLNTFLMIQDLRIVLNMDECGFGKYPDYKKRHNCFVLIKKAKSHTVWLPETDIYHISWICCVSAACNFTTHMFVSTYYFNSAASP